MGCNLATPKKKKFIRDDISDKKKKGIRGTRQTDFDKASQKEEDNDQDQIRKAHSRLSGTRNSIIIAKKNIEQYGENNNPSHQFQLIYFNNDYESESERVPQEDGINQLFLTKQINLNCLKQISKTCSINLQKPIYSMSSFVEILQESQEYEESSNNQILKSDIIALSRDFQGVEQDYIIKEDSINYKRYKWEKQSSLQQDSQRQKLVYRSQQQITCHQTLKDTEILKQKLLGDLTNNIGESQDINQQQEIKTLYFLIETIQLSYLNLSAVVWMLKKRLQIDGINLIYLQSPKDQKKIKVNKNQSQKNILKFSRLFLMSTNVSPVFWELKLGGSNQKINFRTICGQKSKIKEFLDNFETQIKKVIQKFDPLGFQMQWINALIDDKGEQTLLTLQFYLPNLSINLNKEFQKECTKLLQEEMSSTFRNIKSRYIINKIIICEDLFDVWENREFKTTNEDDQLMDNDIFKYIKPVGWKRFGLMKEQSDISLNLQQAKLVNVFLRVSMGQNSFKNKNDFFQAIRMAQDIGPNKDRFEDKYCGTGIVCCSNITNFLPSTTQSQIPDSYRAKPIQLVVHNESWYYYIMLQGQVDGSKIRVPENYNKEIFIMNDLNSISLDGILIKEISEIEYQESLMFFS